MKVIEAEILSSSSDCRGIARQDGKVWFVDFALPTEVVRFRVIKNKNSHGFGVVEEVLKRSPSRTEPHCEYFGICGGCALQHIEASYQNVIKQQVLLDQLERDSGIVPQQVLPPLGGSPWGYRRKARLGVRLVPKKGGRFAFGRLIDRRGELLGILPPGQGQKQDVIKDAPWIAVAEMLVRTL